MTRTDTDSGLIAAGDLDAPFANLGGGTLSRRQYIADAAALAERLPHAGAMLNLSTDRYRFAVGLGAALLRGHTSLLPPNHVAETVARLRARFAGVYALVEGDADDHGLPAVRHANDAAPAAPVHDIPTIALGLVAAYVLTSGSTGEPMPHAKPWGLLVRNARAEARRLAAALGRDDLAGVTVIATVPPQHMYGFESSVLIALHGGAILDAERPFFPADIAAALARADAPRVLVTTPFHLKTVLEAGLVLPPLALVVSATAPLSPQLAALAEQRLGAPLLEIYGCTEAGQVASRRTTAGAEWRTFDGVRLAGEGAAVTVSGGHVPEPTVLADVLEVVDAETFRLLGRSNDLINVAGKRSSIGHLDFHLNSIEGVVDGAFWMPPESASDPGGIVRLVAFVVAPGVARERIVAALRDRVDAAFLPRRIVHLDALPREATGKLTRAKLGELAARQPAPRTAMNEPVARRNLAIASDHPAFDGHFPGQPVLPGVALLAEVLEAARDEPRLAACIGAAPSLAIVKFLAPVRPGALLAIDFRLGARSIYWRVGDGQREVASGQIARADLGADEPR